MLLEVIRLPVVETYGFREGIFVGFVGEDQLSLRAVVERGPRYCLV